MTVQAFSSFSSYYSPAGNGASGGSAASSSQQPQPRDGLATTPTKQQPGCTWASTGMAMWREIGFGFNSLPDFASPRKLWIPSLEGRADSKTARGSRRLPWIQDHGEANCAPPLTAPGHQAQVEK